MNELKLSQRFYNFAKNECKGSSELYEFLSVKVSQDNEILRMCATARSGQPIPNLLFGAIHYLLLKGKKHPLRAYYPSLGLPHKIIDDHTFDYFKDFCHVYQGEIIAIMKNKLVQTNEVRRCAYLYPIFSYIYSKVEKPLSLIEIGTSAGLQLLWDKYSYTYGDGKVYGDKNSDVHITSEIKGKHTPAFSAEMPPVANRIGIDLHISDVSNSHDLLWLQSLIWPEHRERLTLLKSAASYLKDHSIELIEGNGVVLLTDIVKTLPEDTVICIFHTHVANQMSRELKNTLFAKIKEIGNYRNVFHLYNNMWDEQLHLDYFMNGMPYNQTIGNTDGHGRWFEWDIKNNRA